MKKVKLTFDRYSIKDTSTIKFICKIINFDLFHYKINLKKNNKTVYGCYKLMDKKNIIGYLEFHVDNSIWSVRINKENRGKGIGYKFLDSVLRYIKQNSEIKEILLNVYIGNEIAIKLYKKLGFEIYGINKYDSNSYVMGLKF